MCDPPASRGLLYACRGPIGKAHHRVLRRWRVDHGHRGNGATGQLKAPSALSSLGFWPFGRQFVSGRSAPGFACGRYGRDDTGPLSQACNPPGMNGMRMANDPKYEVWVVVKVRIDAEMIGQIGGPVRHRGWGKVISYRAAMACALRSRIDENPGLMPNGAVEFGPIHAGCEDGLGLSSRRVSCVP